MKTLSINFRSWEGAGGHGNFTSPWKPWMRVYKVYRRLYFRGYWTPFVIIKWS